MRKFGPISWFSHFPIFLFIHGLMGKWENWKMRKSSTIFAFSLFPFSNGKMKKIRSLISDFPLIGPNHRYFHYVIFTSYLDVYLIWPPCPNQQKHCEVKFPFSNFPIFLFFHGKIRKWEMGKWENSAKISHFQLSFG